MARVKLGDVAREYRETCKGSKKGLRAVGLEHLEPENIALTQWETSSDNTFSKLFYEGQMLFGRRRAYLKKAALAPFDGICSGDITVIEANPEKLLPTLMPFIIQSNAFFDFAIEGSAGSLSPRVKWEHLSQYEFNLPSMEEQEKLAEVLWAFEKTKSAYKTLLDKTEELVQAQFIEMFGDPVTNPMKWPQKSLANVCTSILGGGTPSKSHPEYFQGTIPWVSPKDMKSNIIFDSQDHITEEAVKNSTTNIIVPNSVLLVIRSGILKHTLPVAINKVPVAINQDMKAFIPSNEILPEFLMSYFKNIEQNILSGVRAFTADNIDFKTFQQRLVLLPPLELQHQFCKFIITIEYSMSALNQSLSTLDQARNTLMEKTFR